MLSVNKVISSFRVGMEGSKCSRVCLNCDEKSLTQVVAYVNQFGQISNTMEILPMAKASRPVIRFTFGKFMRFAYCLQLRVCLIP